MSRRQLTGRRLRVEIGRNYRLDASTNLADWVSLQTSPGTDSVLIWRDRIDHLQRFYRAVQLP
jgi:hypothetical protein